MDGVSDEGRATIITCGLNRKDLLGLRAKIASDTLREIRALVIALEVHDKQGRQDALEALAELGARHADFTSMVRWLFEKYVRIEWTNLPGFPA